MLSRFQMWFGTPCGVSHRLTRPLESSLPFESRDVYRRPEGALETAACESESNACGVRMNPGTAPVGARTRVNGEAEGCSLFLPDHADHRVAFAGFPATHARARRSMCRASGPT